MGHNDNAVALTSAVNKEVAKFSAVADQIAVISGGTVEGQDAMLLSSMFFSGYFKDIDSLSKAVVRVAFGKRIGVDVATAVTSLYIIDGKPALEAQAIRNGCIQAGYDIETLELNNDGCLLQWSFNGKVLGESKFTKTDAIRRGLIDPTCTGFPETHNERPMTVWRWDNSVGRKTKQQVQGCECKDNWKSMPEEMYLARATTKGNKMYGNRAFKQEVYSVDEMTDSNLRADTTAIDIIRGQIEFATDTQTLQEITKQLTPEELAEVLEDITAKTKELLNGNADDSTKTDTDNSGSPAKE